MGSEMMERRSTITRGWKRSDGRPAPRHDDYVEQDLDTPAPALQPPTVDRCPIIRRLENYGRWARSAKGSTAATCMTGALCDALRKSAGAAPITDSGIRSIDSTDAVLIGRALVKVSIEQRRLLGLQYVEEATKGYIAARAGISVKDFDTQMDGAYDALETALAAIAARSK